MFKKPSQFFKTTLYVKCNIYFLNDKIVKIKKKKGRNKNPWGQTP